MSLLTKKKKKKLNTKNFTTRGQRTCLQAKIIFDIRKELPCMNTVFIVKISTTANLEIYILT